MKPFPFPRMPFYVMLALLPGMAMTAFAAYAFGARLLVSVNGTVVQRRVAKGTGPYRWNVEYILRRADGIIATYRTHGDDPSLSRDIAVGAYLVKRRWRLSYRIDGQNIRDFPIRFCALNGVTGMLLFLFGVIGAWVSRRQPTTLGKDKRLVLV